MINLRVDLGDRSYPIFIGDGILANLGEMCRLYGFGKRVVVITDQNVERLYGEQVRDSLRQDLDSFEIITVRPGEPSKSLKNAESIIAGMLELGCERNSAVVALGGGVVGDLAGFVASVYKRGVPLIQVPTTLLAQVDASVGGKTAVNHPLGKNMIGTFYQPSLVWIDLAVLKTLPKREINCGLGEIIKYGLIWDTDLFELVESNLDEILSLDSALMSQVVKRCCEIKAEIVSQDERDEGLRMVLNFGHTVGHAIEAALGYKNIAHGEAVLLGMLAESKIALEAGLLKSSDFKRIEAQIARFGLTRRLSKLTRTDLLRFIRVDKKILDEKLKFVLPTGLGHAEIVDDMESALLDRALNDLLKAE